MAYLTTNFDAWIEEAIRPAAPSPFSPHAFLRELGLKMLRGERTDVQALPGGGGRLVVEYSSFADMLSVLRDLDAIRAMAQVDQGARPHRGRPKAASSE